MVPTGHEIPVFGAVVYLALQRPAPIPDGVYCDKCIKPPGSPVFTDHAGAFRLDAVRPASYWLVIEKGQFRLEQEVTVVADSELALTGLQTTLPSAHDPANGRWVPKIALASGRYDQLEDVIGKMGIGEVDTNGRLVPSSAAGRFDVYANDGAIDNVAIASLSELARDYARLSQYHIVFVPCSSGGNALALREPAVLRNLRRYVADGGKLYVTDWSGEWMDNAFPAQLELRNESSGPRVDTPAEAFDPTTETWNTSLFGDADDSSLYDSDDAEAVDPDLHTWLNGQQGPTAASAATSTFNASRFEVVDAWDHIVALHPVQVGVDSEGFSVIDEPKALVIGSDGFAGGKKPLTVTFEPTGCGRVLFSTYHTTETNHRGLVPQERILLFLIMEIGVCKDGPIVD
jgi:hypothetical protein